MNTLLLTGFEPFLDHTRNPSALLAEALDDVQVAGFRVEGVVLPVDYDRVGPAFADAFAQTRPAAVILCGLAFETDAIRLERVALNLDDTKHADNSGTVRRARPIQPGGPVGHWSTLPLDIIADRLAAAGVPITTSRDAGGYLCNHLFFIARQATEGTGIPCGFVHLPPLPEQVADRSGRTGMDQMAQLEAMRLIIATVRAAMPAA